MKPGKLNDLDMLMTCKTIAENFALHINDLQHAKEEWNEQYAANLEGEIERALNYYLGFEANNHITHSRNKFNHIQAQAIRAIAFLKTRIDIIYALDEKRKNKILNLLGFEYYRQALHERDASALLDLLINIEKNLTVEIKEELIRNAGDQAFLERIVSYASKIKRANDSQHSLMATKKAIAEDARNLFNSVLLKILEISQVVADFYKDNPEKARLFDYAAVLQSHFPDSVQSN